MSPLTRRQVLRSGVGLVASGGVATLGGGCFLAPRPRIRVMDAVVGANRWRLDAGGARTTAAPILGTPAVGLTTPADGSSAGATLARTQPVDLRNHALRLRLRVEEEGAEHLERIDVRIGSGLRAFESASFQSIVLPDAVDGYGSEWLKPGEDVAITLGPASFASTPQDEGLYFDVLQDFAISATARRGHRATVAFGDLDVVPGPPTRPRGLVSFCFDDGLASHLTQAMPILTAHGFAATTYLIHDLVGVEGYLGAEGVRALVDAGWDAAAHADQVAVHNARGGVTRLGEERILADWAADRHWLRAARLSRGADYAYPQGRFDAGTIAALARFGHFGTARTESFRSIETLPPADPWRLRTVSFNETLNVGPPDRVGSIMWRIAQTAAYGGWIILSFHDVTDGVAKGSAVAVADFERIVRYVARRRVPVRTVAQVRREVLPSRE